MKKYSLCVVDSEGETVLDYEISADDVITMLKNEPYKIVEEEKEVFEEVVEEPKQQRKKTTPKPASEIKEVSSGGRKRIDKEQVLEDLKTMDPQDVADKHGTSKQVIFNIRNKHKSQSPKAAESASPQVPTLQQVVNTHVKNGRTDEQIKIALNDSATQKQIEEAIAWARKN